MHPQIFVLDPKTAQVMPVFPPLTCPYVPSLYRHLSQNYFDVIQKLQN